MSEEKDDYQIDSDSDIDDSVVAEESAQEAIKKLRTRLKECEAKVRENLDGWQRAQADFLNLRKRDEEERQEFFKFANLGLMKELIPVLDSFNIALSHPDSEPGAAAIEPIYGQLMNILKSVGLEELDPVGNVFDPSMHEAIGMSEVESKEDDHKVTEVLQKGYTLNGKVIRPAKVRIGEYKG